MWQRSGCIVRETVDGLGRRVDHDSAWHHLPDASIFRQVASSGLRRCQKKAVLFLAERVLNLICQRLGKIAQDGPVADLDKHFGRHAGV